MTEQFNPNLNSFEPIYNRDVVDHELIISELLQLFPPIPKDKIARGWLRFSNSDQSSEYWDYFARGCNADIEQLEKGK